MSLYPALFMFSTCINSLYNTFFFLRYSGDNQPIANNKILIHVAVYIKRIIKIM